MRDRLRLRFFKPESKARTGQEYCRGDEPLVERIQNIYHSYWSQVMSRTMELPAAEDQLLAALNELSGTTLISSDFDTIETTLERLLLAEGVNSLFGVVTPFRSFMAWRTNEKATFEVETLGGQVTLHVNLLNGFIEKGWLAYATFDEKFVGGWENEQGVCAVMPAWEGGVNGDRFRISLLKHEGQHALDRIAYPWMKSAQLEFRAKLNEIAFSKDPEAQISEFVRQGSPHPVAPHAYASWHLGNVFQSRHGETCIIAVCREAFARSAEPDWMQ